MPAITYSFATDKEDAAYIQNTLEGIFHERSVRFFSGFFRRPMNFEVLDNTNMLQRTETINKVTAAVGSEIIHTYPEALSKKWSPQSSWKSIELK